MKNFLLGFLTIFALGTAAFAQSVKVSNFGLSKTGDTVKKIKLENKYGASLVMTNFGATIISINVPDREGILGDIALGFDALSEYQKPCGYIGATIGRYANRISNGKFAIDGEVFDLSKNNGTNTSHGGKDGFDKRVWNFSTATNDKYASAIFSLVSPDGDQGFPGKLEVKVIFTLSNDNSLRIDYYASSDKKTVCNLTQHTYFNLAGAGHGNVLSHELTVNADQFTPVDSEKIPTGKLKDVADTPFDFRSNTPIGARIFNENEQLRIGRGYDVNFVLNNYEASAKKINFAARLYDPISGRQMEIFTTEPAMQFYTGNGLNGSLIGKHGKVYRRFYGLALETQHFPNSPNEKSFPSTLITPESEYNSTTILRFSAQ